MATYSNSAREVEMPNGDVVVLHSAPTGGANTTSNIKKFKYDDNGHVTESTAADAEDLNLSGYSTPTTGSTDIGTSDDVQTAIGKLDHQSHIDQTNILLVGKQIDAITNALSASDFNWTLGKVISSYGVIVDDAPYGAITDAMNIDSATAITAPSFSYQDNPINCMVIQYNANNEMVGVRANAAGDVVELLDTATYFRLSFQFGSTSGVTVTQDIINSVFKCNLLYSTENTANAVVELVDKGAKNLLDFASLEYADQHGSPTVTKTDTTITIAGTNSWTRAVYSGIHLPAGTYVLSVNITSATFTTGSVGTIRIVDNAWATGGVAYLEFNSVGKASCIFVVDTESDLYFSFSPNYSGSDISTANSFTATDIMICTKAEYDISPAYAPYSRPNYDLTRLESEDRASLAEVVDSGAKNLLSLNTAVSSGSIWYPICPIPEGTYIISGKFSTSAAGAIAFNFYNGNGQEVGLYEGTTTPVTQGTTITLTGTATQVKFWTQTDNVTISDWMICTKAAFGVSQKFVPFGNDPFNQVPINHNMIYRGQNLGDTLTADQDTALSSGNFTDLYLGDYWTKQVTIPAFYEVTAAEPSDWSTNYTSYYTKSGDTYTAVIGESAPTWAANTYYERLVPSQTVTLKAVIADFDTFYAGYASGYAAINTHHAAVIVTGFSNVVWNKTNTTAGGYVNSLIHKWLVNSALPQIETWFGSAKVLSHQKLLTSAITGDAASEWAWSSQKISLLSENQMYGSKVWGGSKATNGGYEPGEAFKHLNVFNHIDANLLFGNKNIWLRDIASAGRAAFLDSSGFASSVAASNSWVAPAALILLS